MWWIDMLWIVGICICFALLWVFLTRCRRNHGDWAVLWQYRYAHRGLHDKPQVPENSMAAFRKAVEHGFGAELDIHLMADGNLAVIHDSSLLRTAGADVHIEDLSAEDLEQYRLEGTQERIPLLPEVLKLFAGKTPLIVELKAERGNHVALCEAAAKLLDTYGGDYCVESFDPRAVGWFRKHRPEVCRGQLAENFLRDRENRLSLPLRFALTNLLTNAAAVPDFVAYRFSDRKTFGLRLCRFLWKPQMVYWTLRSREELEQAEREGALCIFEKFAP